MDNLILNSIEIRQKNEYEIKYSEYLRQNGFGIIPFDIQKKILNGLVKDFPVIFYKGNLDLIEKKGISIVGTRKPTEDGERRAKTVAFHLSNAGYVIISGLASGIDTVAHWTCLNANTNTIAVLGTPLHKVYPAENKELFNKISEKGLVISPSLPTEEWGKYLFPRRNRLMAQLSIATVVIEAGPTSGVKHQASECLKRKKKLFFLKSMLNADTKHWVNSFIGSGGQILDSVEQMIEEINAI